MDRLLYVAMTGAKETLRAQAANNHNLANASTTGFRADLSAFQSRAVDGLRLRVARLCDELRRSAGTHVGAHDVDRPRSRRGRPGDGLHRGAGPGRHARPTRAPATCASIRTGC